MNINNIILYNNINKIYNKYIIKYIIKYIK